MTVYAVLADITEALRTSHLDHAAIRAEMATKADLAKAVAEVRAEMATKADLAKAVAEVRAEMATKADLAKVLQGLQKLGIEFEAMRHDFKIVLEMLSELTTRTRRHEEALEKLQH